MEERRVLLVMIGLLGLLLLSACSNSEREANAILPKVLTITATDIAYDTNTIALSTGQALRLTLQNDGVLEHDFSIMEIALEDDAQKNDRSMEAGGHDMSHMAEEPAVHVAALAEESNTISFTPSLPGTYEYFCTVAGHKEAGMRGMLLVSTPSE